MECNVCDVDISETKEIDVMRCPSCQTVHHIDCPLIICWEPDGVDDCFVEHDLFDSEVTSVLDWSCCGYQQKRVEDSPPPPSAEEIRRQQQYALFDVK